MCSPTEAQNDRKDSGYHDYKSNGTRNCLAPSDRGDRETLKGRSSKGGHDPLIKATRLGAMSLAFLVLASSLTIPYLQTRRDELGCDAVCYGSMTSTRSTLALIGSALVGRFSDMGRNDESGGGNRRRLCLLVGVLAAGISIVLANRAQTLNELWWSLPPYLLQQNMSVMKALFSDYHSMYDHEIEEQEPASGPPVKHSNRTDRASSAGSLGMVSGFAFMIGPMMGSMMLSSYDQAVCLALVLLLLSATMAVLLPSTETNGKRFEDGDEKSNKKPNKNVLSLLDVPSARSPAALFLLSNRLLLSLSDHVYTVIGPTSLKQRFQFGPKQYGMFFSMIGLFYAIAQGFAAKIALRKFGGDTSSGRSRLLVSCVLIVSIGRYWAYQSTNLVAVYIIYAIMITAVGITATIMNADATRVPAAHEVGSFFGIMGAVESGAGVVGPLLSSALVSTLDTAPQAPLYAAVILNIASVLLTLVFYKKCLPHQNNQAKKEKLL